MYVDGYCFAMAVRRPICQEHAQVEASFSAEVPELFTDHPEFATPYFKSNCQSHDWSEQKPIVAGNHG
jgi:hypothetical protein